MQTTPFVRSIAAALALSGCLPSPAEPDAALELHTFDDAAGRGLVCNDGTPAGYYVRRAAEGARTWMIYYQGGKFCESIETCQARKQQAPQLMTSNGIPEWLPAQLGILSTSPTDNPDFADANQVVIPYCSSDLWSGDREASSDTGGWHFRGRRIADAVIAELIDPAITSAPNLADAHDVLVAGSSAGGIGVLVNADAVTARIPAIHVAALDDAGWFQDLEPLAGTPLRERIQGAVALWGGRPDDDCAQANPGAEWRCYIGAYVVPFLETPLFGYMALTDKNLLNETSGTIITPPATQEQQEFITRFSANVAASLAPLTGAFAPNVVEHTAASSASFGTIELEGQTLRSLVGNWFFERGGPTKVIGHY